MRKAFGLALALVAVAGCSKGPDHGDRDRALSASNDSAEAPAGIAPTAAPGVAFNYKYAFRLPAGRISAVQEEHAQACEKLGLQRCRITGMYYHLTGDRDVEARLEFKLDPAIARAFGKDGIGAVNRADGLLVTSEISGTDVGTQIDAANRTEAQHGDTLAKIEAQLAKPGLGAAERAELQRQAQQVRETIAASRSDKAEKQESLAKTPMTFAYESGDMAPGVRRSLGQGLENLVGALEWMLLAAITLLPWAALAALGLLAWRRLKPGRRSAEEPVPGGPAAP